MKQGLLLTLHHILSVIFYCDLDTLSFKFSSTYRAMKANESIEEITARHSNFYWFGRYLRELVEGFGKDMEENRAYFHGISGNVRFTSTIAQFYHPMSID